MADLRTVEDLVPDRTTTTYQGTMVNDFGVLRVNVNGNIIPARYADPLVLAAGDPVLVDISSSRAGQGTAFVRTRLTAAPRPGQGKVLTVPASSPTITVTGSDGVVYPATFVASYTPVVGDAVILSWNAAVASVIGKITTTAAPPPPPPPIQAPPTAATTGSTPYPAVSSGTWVPTNGVWDSHAGGGSNVYQGSYGATTYGAWFYAGSTAQQAGKTITRIRFVLGARRPVGNNNSPVLVHFYAHTSPNKPGGDVARTVGPYDVVAQPGQGPTQYDLPLSFAPVLQAGGGIAIAGDPYAGFLGVQAHPESGLLTLDWSS